MQGETRGKSSSPRSVLWLASLWERGEHGHLVPAQTHPSAGWVWDAQVQHWAWIEGSWIFISSSNGLAFFINVLRGPFSLIFLVPPCLTLLGGTPLSRKCLWHGWKAPV